MSWLSKTLGLDKIRNRTGVDPIKPIGDVLKSFSRDAVGGLMDGLIVVARKETPSIVKGLGTYASGLGISAVDVALLKDFLETNRGEFLGKLESERDKLLDKWF